MKINSRRKQSGMMLTEEANRAIDQREKRFRRRLQIYVAALLGVGVLSVAPSQATGQAVRQLSALDGTNGFRVDGVATTNRVGTSVSGAGDINGDGFADLIIGAPFADPNNTANGGSSYVVFGKAAVSTATLNLSSLDGTNGFRIDGEADGDSSGESVSGAGDINGDGFDDLIIGSRRGSNSIPGRSYVVFGKATGWGPSIDLASLSGTGGFRLAGFELGDRFGYNVSGAGDINSDGFDDLIFGAYLANAIQKQSGSSYVIFGKTSGWEIPLNLSSLDGTDGFRLNGAALYGISGCSVSGAGDVNGDGFEDFVIGAFGTRYDGNDYSGSTYVVFGKATGWNPAINLSTLDGTNGFRLDGMEEDGYSGNSVSGAGDINGDGFADLVIGSYFAAPNGKEYAGSAYVVFGKAAWAAVQSLSSLDGTNGFRLNGVEAQHVVGTSVAGAGDINGDGFADLILGAWGASPNGKYSGSTYVVYGKANAWAPSQDLSFVDGTNGFRLDGTLEEDRAGEDVSGAGDVNGDGFADIIIGAYIASPNGIDESGSSYVVFGSGQGTGRATYRAHSRPGDAPPSLPGTLGDGSDHPNSARTSVDFLSGTTTSLETVTLYRATSGTVTGIMAEDTADAVWQITTDRASFTTAVVTLTYLNSEVERVTSVAGEAESSLTMYQSASPSGPWIPLPTTVNTAKNEAAAPVTAFGYFLLGAPPLSGVRHWDLY